MNNQEAFNKMIEGLASQGFKRSESMTTMACAYRGANGMRCAVGWCIPDEDYSPLFEGRLADEIHSKVPSLQGVDLDLLYEAQHIHDSNTWPESKRQNYIRLGKRMGLELPDALSIPIVE